MSGPALIGVVGDYVLVDCVTAPHFQTGRSKRISLKSLRHVHPLERLAVEGDE